MLIFKGDDLDVKNSDYWKSRFGQLEAAQNQKGTDAYLEIEKIYKQAQKEIWTYVNTLDKKS